MKLGMMWSRSAKESIEDSITQASEYYSKKYGQKPNCVHVNPSEFTTSPIQDYTVIPSKSILPGNIWIGVDDK